MKQLLHLLAFGLLVPSTALAQVDAEVELAADVYNQWNCSRWRRRTYPRHKELIAHRTMVATKLNSTVQRRQGFLWLRQGLHHSGPAFR